MKRIDLIKVEHNIKIGKECPFIEPNIKEDSLFYEDGVLIGFFIKNIDGNLKKYVDIANKEFRSKNVPKTKMARAGKLRALQMGKSIKEANEIDVEQMSCIIGSVPPKALMRREYANRSSVHNVESAQTFIKAMLLACRESEELIKKIMPEQFELQKSIIEESVPEHYRFGRLFTSSISNYNISAPFHRDAGNLKNCVNVIITKKFNAKGGNLHVPDYNATMDSANNSLLVYPAWKNIHGVTPIIETKKGGYRNSLIFYPLKAFKGLD
jgi:hypothetical protein